MARVKYTIETLGPETVGNSAPAVKVLETAAPQVEAPKTAISEAKATDNAASKVQTTETAPSKTKERLETAAPETEVATTATSKTKDTGIASSRAETVKPAPPATKKRALETGSPAGPQAEVASQQLSSIDQSRELLKILLHTTLATILFLRTLLPAHCFFELPLKNLCAMNSYTLDDFLSTEPSPSGIKKPNKSKKHKESKETSWLEEMTFGMIQSSKDRRADQFLQLLGGIFDAIAQGALDGFQIAIMKDQDDPMEVLESYTFTIDYSGRLGRSREDMDGKTVRFVDPQGDKKCLLKAANHIQAVLRNLVTLSSGLPKLPETRSMGIYLFYRYNLSARYEAPGFEGTSDDFIQYPILNNWQRQTDYAGKCDTGLHTAGLKITSFRWVGAARKSRGGAACPFEGPAPMKREEQPIKRTEDIGIPSKENGIPMSLI